MLDIRGGNKGVMNYTRTLQRWWEGRNDGTRCSRVRRVWFITPWWLYHARSDHLLTFHHFRMLINILHLDVINRSLHDNHLSFSNSRIRSSRIWWSNSAESSNTWSACFSLIYVWNCIKSATAARFKCPRTRFLFTAYINALYHQLSFGQVDE